MIKTKFDETKGSTSTQKMTAIISRRMEAPKNRIVSKVKNTSVKSVPFDFIQMGICKSDLSDYEQNFASRIMSGVAETDYVLSQNLCCIIALEEGIEYICWVNFGSCNNKLFEKKTFTKGVSVTAIVNFIVD